MLVKFQAIDIQLIAAFVSTHPLLHSSHCGVKKLKDFFLYGRQNKGIILYGRQKKEINFYGA